MANWFIASFQSRLARLQSAVMLRSASQINLLAAASLGKYPVAGEHFVDPGARGVRGLNVGVQCRNAAVRSERVAQTHVFDLDRHEVGSQFRAHFGKLGR